MGLLNITLLYKNFKTGLTETAKTDKIIIPYKRVKRLRIHDMRIFKFVKHLVNYIHRKPDKEVVDNRLAYPNQLLSNTFGYNYGIRKYLISICEAVVTWNIIQPVSETAYIHEVVVVNCRSVNCNINNAQDTALDTTTYLAYGVGLLYRKTGDSVCLRTYNRLLDGIDRCILDHDNKTILMYPTHTDLHGLGHITIDLVAKLMLLISGFGKVCGLLTVDLEDSIRDKICSIFEHHDYLLVKYDKEPLCHDLYPNALYTLNRGLSYVCLRICSGKFNTNDAVLLKTLLETNIPEPFEYSDYDTQRMLNTATLLEAILNFWNTDIRDSVDRVLTKKTYMSLAIIRLEQYQKYNIATNPELEAILFRFYYKTDNYAMLEDTVIGIQRIINVLYDNDVITKSESTRLEIDRTKFGIDNSRLSTPLPPLYRMPVDNYWLHDPRTHGSRCCEYPVFEYLTVYARIVEYLKE